MKLTLVSLKKKLEDKSKDELIEDMFRILKEKEKISKDKEKLERELKKYKNANTPSSANSHLQTNTQKTGDKKKVNKVGRKKGKKSRHKGRTNH